MYFFPMPKAYCFEVRGRHSQRYLQARLTNDVARLSPGNCCLAAALSPQGRIEVFCWVGRLDQERFLLVVDGGEREKALAALRAFVVADRVEFLEPAGVPRLLCHVAGQELISKSLQHLEAHMEESETQFSINGEVVISRRRRTVLPGVDILLEGSRVESFLSLLQQWGGKNLCYEAQTLERLRAQILSFPEELNADRVLAESDVPGSVSFTKGCYVGQEVIAKIDAHGRAPRVCRVLRVQGEQVLRRGDEISALIDGTAKSLGEVLSVAYDAVENQWLCFADLKNLDNLFSARLFTNGRAASLVRSVAAH